MREPCTPAYVDLGASMSSKIVKSPVHRLEITNESRDYELLDDPVTDEEWRESYEYEWTCYPECPKPNRLEPWHTCWLQRWIDYHGWEEFWNDKEDMRGVFDIWLVREETMLYWYDNPDVEEHLDWMKVSV